MAQHLRPGHTPPLRLVDAEDRPEVAETRGGQQRVAEGVNGDIAVGMSGTAVGAIEQQAQQPTGPAGVDGVHIGAQPHSRQGHESSTARANRRSSGVVTLNASGSPATVCTGVPRLSTRDASSVTAMDPAR